MKLRTSVRSLLTNLNPLRRSGALLGLALAVAAPSAALAVANYVYHEQTGNNPGCGTAPYVDVLTPVAGQAVNIRFKIEFQFYTDTLRVYYTTDGTTPSGAKGVPSGTTQVINGSYNCTFSSGGNVVDVGAASISAQARGTTVKYIIGAWHSGGGAEIFANSGTCGGCGDCEVSTCATVFQYTVTGFTPGSVVVERVGDGSAALASVSTPVSLFEFPAAGGAALQTISLPNAATRPSANPFNLTDTGSGTSAGHLSRSVNGQLLCVPGYNGISGDAAIATSSGATISRITGVLGSLATVDTSRAVNMFSGANYRSVASVDGTAFWAAGNVGLVYVTFPGSPVSLSAANCRVVKTINGQLYYSLSSGTAGASGIYALGSGLPISGTPAATQIIVSQGTAPSPYGYDINPSSTTAYVADDRAAASGGGISKFTSSGGPWSFAYTIATPARGIVVDWSGPSPVIYATTTTSSANLLVAITDTGAASSPTTLATAAANTAFRGVAFSPILAPAITSFTPSSGAVGDLVTISGANLNTVTAVSFNGASSSAITVVSSTSIKATVPVSATTGKITVVNPAGTATSTANFTVLPKITSFTPTSGRVGDPVTITGTTFTGATAVKFNTTPAVTFSVDLDTQITATVPVGATTGKITVTTPSGTSGPSTASFIVLPKITSFNPTSGPIGASIIIKGNNFTGTTSVKFNGQEAAPVFTVDSDIQITATVPAGATTGKISVTNPDGSDTTTTDFTVFTPPAITCPPDKTVQCPSLVPAAAIDSAGFIAQGGTITSGGCAGGYTVTSGDIITSGSCANKYSIKRTYFVKDACNLSTFCNQFITVNDTTGPVFTGCPAAAISLACNSSPTCADALALGITANDNCDGPITPTCSAGLTVAGAGCQVSKTFTLTATDSCGNSKTCDVTYTWTVDATGPTLSPCPADITITASSADGAIVYYTKPTASDGCGPAAPIVNCDFPSGSTFPVGMTTVTCSTHDDCNNPGSCQFKVTVKPPAGAACFQPDNGTGTATLPPVGCQYFAPDDVMRIIDGSPETIELTPIQKDFICVAPPCVHPGGALGGESEDSSSTLQLHVRGTGSLSGMDRMINIPLNCEALSAQRNPGQPVQSFDTEMLHLQGQITGDPDFDLLRITAGNGFGLPSPGHTTLTRQAGGNWAVDSFFDIEYRIDFVGHSPGPLSGHSGSTTGTIRMQAGAAPVPPTITCPDDIFVSAPTQFGSVQVQFNKPTATDNCNAGAPPPTVTCDHNSGDSFPSGGTKVCCTATDSCGNTATCCFYIYVMFDSPFVDPLVPAPVAQHTGPPNLQVTYPGSGSNFRFTRPILINRPPSTPPPPAFRDCFFDVFLDVDLDGHHSIATGTGILRESPTLQSGPRQTIPTEMIALSLNGLPPGTMIRESPSKQSLGQTTVRQVPSGLFAIDSFFDVFTELSLDGGNTWTPSDNPLHVVQGWEPTPIDAADANLPPPGRFVSEPEVTTIFNVQFLPRPIIIKNICHGGWIPFMPPPDPGQTEQVQFGSSARISVSTDGGSSFFDVFLQKFQPAIVQVTAAQDSSTSRYFDTEMLQLDLRGGGGGLPPVMIRESPTLQSLGKIRESPTLQSTGQKISSFFDVFTEISLDGGANWTPASDAALLTLVPTVCAQIVCPPDAIVQCSDSLDPAVNPVLGTPIVTSICGTTPTVRYDDVQEPGGNPPCLYVIDRTWTATDTWGAITQCVQHITVKDTTPPVLTVNCPPAGTCYPSEAAAIADIKSHSSALDACCPNNPTINVVRVAGAGSDCAPVFAVTATDCCNNTSAPQNCTVHVDGTPPTFVNCPADQDLGCNPANIPGCDNTVRATDNCDAAPHIDCSFADTGGPCRHIRTITYTATDSCGNHSTCIQRITWRTDTQDPVFTKCPADIDLGCNPTVPIPVCDLSPANVAATDNCGTPTITCSSADGGTACAPTRTITYKATDACGHTAFCVQHITWRVDTTKPVVTCPADMTVSTNNANGATVSYSVTATDNCDGPMPAASISCNPPSGYNFPVGTTRVDCFATDSCGNKGGCSFNVTVSEKSTHVYVSPAYRNKPCGTSVNFPDNGQPGPLTVCVDAFGTMQAGVNATAPGGTLTVGPGRYPELVQVTSPMTINGANAGVDPRTTCNGGAVRGAESIIDGNNTETAIEFDSSGITLDGFTIQGGSVDSAHSGVDLHNFYDNNKVLNNIITANTVGVFANCAGPLATVIQKNRIDSNNLLCGCPSEGAGLYVDASVNLQILDNEITGHTQNNPLLIAATGAGSHTGMVVSGNYVHDNACGCSAVYVLGITGGTFSKNQISGPATGLRLASGNSDIDVSNNSFISGTVGVRLIDDGYGFPANSNIRIHGNSFGALTSFAVSRDAGGAGSDSDTVLDASANWWGVATPAGVPAKIDTSDGLVDYTPWLVVSTDLGGDPCDGFQGDYSTLIVDAASPQSGAAGRIGEGISLVTSGGTVKIVGGVYTETVVATAKTVTLAPGASPAQVTINGDLTLGPSDTLAFELNGTTPGTDYDQFVVNGGVTLGGATLSATAAFTYADCASLTIIDNDLADAVSGTFAGLPNGSVVTISGQNFKIFYNKGAGGNDVVLVKDTTAPTIIGCPTGPVALPCNSAPTCADAKAAVTASDNCGGTPTLNCTSDPVAPATGCQVSQTFHVTATDANGNTSAPCDITYVWTVDIIKPTVTCPPGSIALACNATPTCADAKAQVTAQDNCDANPTLGCVAGAVQLSGCQASQTFAVTATDACGNVSAPCDVTFTWTQDTTRPVISCPADAVVQCPNPITPATTGTATATDNCDPNPSITSADAAPVEVTTSPGSGWQFRTTDGGNPPNTATAEFVDGPASPPLGTGSARLAVGINGDGAAEIRSTTYNGTLLSALTELRYHTYRTQDGSGGQMPYIILNIDLNGFGATDDQVFFEPVYQTPTYNPLLPDQGPTQTGVWQSWDALAGGWWSNNDPNFTPGTGVKSLADYIKAHPTARLAATANGALRITAGFGAPDWNNFDGNVDAVSVGVNGVSTTYDFDKTAGNTCPVKSVTMRTWTAVDSCGNKASCSQIIKVVDTTPPTITSCPQGSYLGCNPGVAIQPTCASVLPGVAATDTCTAAPTFDCQVNDSDSGCVHTRKFTITAKDACNNVSAPCVVIYTWTVDGTPPVITCPQDAFVQCGQSSGVATATDNCTVTNISFVDTPGLTNCTGLPTVSRAWTAKDECGNSSTCTQMVTYVDGTPPVVTCPPDKQVQCGDSTAPANTGTATATDNCPAAIAITFTDAATPTNCTGRPGIARTWKATDNCGNSATCVQHITIVDTTPPQITCPPNPIQLGCNPTLPTCASAIAQAPAIDNCDANPQFNCTAGAIVPNGCLRSQIFTLNAYDSCNNTSAPCVVTFEWTRDIVAPTITGCPSGPIDLLCNPPRPSCADVNNLGISASDNCTAAITPLCLAGTVQTNGCHLSQVFTVKATDGCLNSSTCLVTYVWTEDTSLPQFTGCPTSAIDLGCNPPRPSCATAATGITASDSCSGNIIPVCTAGVIGTNGCHLSQAFTLKATDGCGNVGTCVVSYVWTEDTTPPVFDTPPFAVCGQTNFLACNVDESTIPICLATITATDNCSAAHVGCSLVQVTNLCAGSLTDGVRTRIITYEADDVCKNTNFCRQVYIWLVDHTPPVFTKCPANINLGCNPNTFPGCDLSPANVAATDACGSTPIITCSVSSDSVNGCVHTRTNIYAASDSCGNTNFCRQVLTWKVDALAFSPQPFADCTGSVTNNLGCNPDPDTIPHCLTAIHATGTCSSNHVSCSLVQVTNQTTCVRTRIITYTADDDCFTNTCRQVYIWTEDPLKPVFTVFPANLNLGCNPTSVPGCNLDPTNVFATKDCPTGFVPPITCVTNETIAGCVHTRKLVYTATGAGPCFNAQSKTQTIIYTVDTDPPVFTKCPTNINLGCNPASIPGGDITTNNVIATGCTVSITVATNDVVNGCTNTRTLTYTAQSACTNLSSCSHTITWIVDTNAPVFANCPAPVLALGCNPPSIPSTNTYNVTVTDDCGTPTRTTNQVDTVTNCLHTRTLTWTATDFCGNTTNCQQFITWTTDAIPPVFTKCPTNVNLGCNPTPASIPVCDLTTNSVIVGDDCTLTNLSCGFVDATNNCVRTRTFTYLAQDECGNSSTCIYTVTWTVDATGPVLSGCPAQATLALGCNPANIPTCASYNVTVSDNCGATVSCASVDATNGCAHTRTLTWTAVDGCNHSTNCHQVISWTQDTTPPVMTHCPAPTLDLGCNPQIVPVCTSYGVGVTDNCSASVTCSSSLTLSNGCQRIRILTYVGKDGCGNTNSCQQTITWTEDTTPPVITNCPAATLALGCTTNVPTCATYNVGATDNCGSATVTCSSSVDTTNGCQRSRTLTWTAYDACSNSSSCSQTITWTADSTPPFFTKRPPNRFLSCNPPLIPDCDLNPTNIAATDICSTVTITCSSSDSNSIDGCFHDRSITYVAKDGCLNATNWVQHIFWTTDTTPPTFINCPANIDLGLNPASIPDCNLNPTNILAEDGCSTPTIGCTSMDSTNGCVRTRTLVYSATDACNNVAYCTEQITWHVDAVPLLSIVVSGSNVVISWPLTCTPFHLQQTPSLSPTTWTNVPQAPVVVNNQNQVTVPINAVTMFFRLIYP